MATEPQPEAIQVDALTAALHRCGVLGADASVCRVVAESSRTTILSRITRLRPEYEGDAGDAPRTLIFKSGLPERSGGAWDAGRQEVAFYAQVAPATPARLLPRCFDSHYDAQTEAWHLLLEDLTDTHEVPTVWPLPPTLAQCDRIVRARARFHVAWWDDPRLGVSVGTRPSAETLATYLDRFAARFATFADRLGDGLPRERRGLFERLLDRGASRLAARYATGRGVTAVHGDAHVWNCFLPKGDGDGGGSGDDDGDDVRLFDGDGWRVGVAASDLAYMMAVHWYPDRRRRFERPLLDRYHAALVAHGVEGYGRAALEEDYRLAVLWQVATPVWQAAMGIPPVIWWNNLERVLLAVEDLGCGDLLGG